MTHDEARELRRHWQYWSYSVNATRADLMPIKAEGRFGPVTPSRSPWEAAVRSISGALYQAIRACFRVMPDQDPRQHNGLRAAVAIGAVTFPPDEPLLNEYVPIFGIVPLPMSDARRETTPVIDHSREFRKSGDPRVLWEYEATATWGDRATTYGRGRMPVAYRTPTLSAAAVFGLGATMTSRRGPQPPGVHSLAPPTSDPAEWVFAAYVRTWAVMKGDL